MTPRRFTTLEVALGLSVAVHAVLLAVRLADPEAFNRVFQDTPLEVILVNARTSEHPEKAQAVAQTALAGGGDLDQGRATSPLPPSSFSTLGDSIEDTQRRVDAMRTQQIRLLAQLKQQLAMLPVADPRTAGNSSDDVAHEEKRRQLIDLLAEIERSLQQENARPKKRYLSPATREAAYAVYVDALRRRIEARGTENFPEAGGQKLYGELRMMVAVNFNGAILSTAIIESSGNRMLDSRAQAIVRSIGDFGAFTAAMRRQADQIVLPLRFRFTHDNALEAQLSSEPS